jgi:hypothetical protein
VGRLFATRARLTRVYDPPALTSAVLESFFDIVERFAAAERRSCPTIGDGFGAAALVEQLAGVSGPLAGRIVLAKTVEFPQPAWPEALASASTFEALGFTVATDGSSLTGPSQPAGGWLVVLGDQRTRTGADGAFQLDVPLGSPVEGQLFHPSNADEPMATFLVTELATAAAPGQLDVELVTQGRCGMNVNPADDPRSKGGRAGARRRARPRGAIRLNPDPTLYPPKISGSRHLSQSGSRRSRLTTTDSSRPASEDTSPVVSYPAARAITRSRSCCDNEGHLSPPHRQLSTSGAFRAQAKIIAPLRQQITRATRRASKVTARPGSGPTSTSWRPRSRRSTSTTGAARPTPSARAGGGAPSACSMVDAAHDDGAEMGRPAH